MLSSILTSTSKIMLTLTAEAGQGEEPLLDDQTASVNRCDLRYICPPMILVDSYLYVCHSLCGSLVEAAFRNCDISQSGKLLPLVFCASTQFIQIDYWCDLFLT